MLVRIWHVSLRMNIAHGLVAFIFEKTFGLKEPGVGNRAIEAWIASKL